MPRVGEEEEVEEKQWQLAAQRDRYAKMWPRRAWRDDFCAPPGVRPARKEEERGERAAEVGAPRTEASQRGGEARRKGENVHWEVNKTTAAEAKAKEIRIRRINPKAEKKRRRATRGKTLEWKNLRARSTAADGGADSGANERRHGRSLVEGRKKKKERKKARKEETSWTKEKERSLSRCRINMCSSIPAGAGYCGEGREEAAFRDK